MKAPTESNRYLSRHLTASAVIGHALAGGPGDAEKVLRLGLAMFRCCPMCSEVVALGARAEACRKFI